MVYRSASGKLAVDSLVLRFLLGGGGGGWWGGGGGLLWGGGLRYFRIFCEKSRGPLTSWNGLMHDPS